MTKQEVIDTAIKVVVNHHNLHDSLGLAFSYVWNQAQIAKIIEYMEKDIAKQSKGLDQDIPASIEG